MRTHRADRRRKMTRPVTATYRSEDLEIVFSGTESYGDDPTVGHIADISIDSAELCGVALDLTDDAEWTNA